MKFRLLVISILLILTFGCKHKQKEKDITTEKNHLIIDTNKADENKSAVATVGSLYISEQLVRYRVAVEQAYGNSGINFTAGLIMTINDALELEIAAKYNQQAFPQEIEQFKLHADASSKAPEILHKIKTIYGKDIQAYNFWFIAPKIVNNKIREYFSSNKKINEDAVGKIKPAMRQIESGKKMKEVAKSLQLNYAIDSIPLKPVDITPALQDYPDARLPFENPILKYVKKMKVGEVYPEIIEENYSFMVIRLLNYNKERYLIERISIQKPDFDSWFHIQAQSLQITIADLEIKNEIQTKYPGLWWIKNFK